MLTEFLFLIAVAILVLALFTYARRRARTWSHDAHLYTADPALMVIGDADWGSLSDREKQVARRVAQGESNKQVAKALGISPQTVGAHLKSIYQKMNLQSRTQLAARLRDIGE